jgi:hypothetical protein
MHLSHVEISLASGTMSEQWVSDLDRLLTGVFGWTGVTRTVDIPERGPTFERGYRMTGDVALVLREHEHALVAGMEDHLGFVVTGDELDRLLDGCNQLRGDEPRLELAHVTNGVASSVDLGDRVLRTFFVRLLLPIWFQFEAREPEADDPQTAKR